MYCVCMYQNKKSTRCDASESSHQLLGMLLVVQVCQLVGTVALLVQVSCLGGVREIINQGTCLCHCMNCLSLSYPLSPLYYNCIREFEVATTFCPFHWTFNLQSTNVCKLRS